ncbi:MAG: hypothetical protein ACQCN5_08555 [Candidatus Bathyarchaeia archaeon]
MANRDQQKASVPSLLVSACRQWLFGLPNFLFRAHLGVGIIEDKVMLALGSLFYGFVKQFCFLFREGKSLLHKYYILL